MCNLSDGIYADAYANAYADATLSRDKEKIAEMLINGKSPEDIHEFCNYPMELILNVQQELARRA